MFYHLLQFTLQESKKYKANAWFSSSGFVFSLILLFGSISSSFAQPQVMMAIPPHASNYNGYVRGYWFVAPTSFTITGLRIPSEAGTGTQNIQVMKVHGSMPVYATMSTNFTTLQYINNAPNGAIQPVNINIAAGDTIGILGQAGTSTSYATIGSAPSMIDAFPVTLNRFIHQASINVNPANDFSSSTGVIGRIEMYYSVGPLPDCDTTTLPSPITLTADNDTLCSVADVELNLDTPMPNVAGLTYQWQMATAAAGPWTDVGAPLTSAPYTAVNVNSTRYYRVQVLCNNTVKETSSIIPIVMSSPLITAKIDGEHCGPGIVDLEAATTPGATLKWYEDMTGGTALGTGPNFTTPLLNTTTDYWVSSSMNSGIDSLSIPLATGNTTGIYHHMFLVHSIDGLNITDISIKCSNPMNTLTDWDIYYRADNYQLVPGANTSSNGWILLSSVTAVPSMGTNDYTEIATGLSLNIPPNATYSLYIAPGAGTMHQYSSPAIGSVTASNSSGELIAGNRGSTLFNCTSSGGQATVKLSYSSGCESPREKVTAHIRPIPDADLGADIDACIDIGTTYLLDAGTYPDNPTFLWEDNSTNQTRQLSSSGTYSVVVTNSFGCSGEDSVDVNLKYNPLLDLGNDTTLCIGESIILNAGSQGITYYWNTGSTNSSILVTESGTYHVAVTNAEGCTGKDTIKVIFDGYLPTMDGIYVRNLAPKTFQFEAINPTHELTYDWDFGDNSVHSALPNPTHTYFAQGDYLVKLKILGSCGHVRDSSYVSIVGIDDLAEDAGMILLYPNPTSHQATLVSQGDARIELVTIYNTLGQKIYTQKALGVHQVELDLKNLASGLYTVQIQTNKGKLIKKLEVLK